MQICNYAKTQKCKDGEFRSDRALHDTLLFQLHVRAPQARYAPCLGEPAWRETLCAGLFCALLEPTPRVITFDEMGGQSIGRLCEVCVCTPYCVHIRCGDIV